MTDTAARPPRKRRWLKRILALLVIGGVLLALFPETPATWLAGRLIALEAGAPGAVEFTALGLGQAKVARLALGGQQQVVLTNAVIDYGPMGALAGRIDRIEIERLDLHLKYGVRASLGDLDPLVDRLRAGGSGGGGAPLPTVIIHQIVAVIDSPFGAISGEGMATFDQNVVYAQFALAEADRRAKVDLDLNIALQQSQTRPQGKISGHIDADSGLWQFLGMPQPSAGALDFAAKLREPPADAPATPVDPVADWTADLNGLAWDPLPAPLTAALAGSATAAAGQITIEGLSVKSTGGWTPDLAVEIAGTAPAVIDLQSFQASAAVDLKLAAKSLKFGEVSLRQPSLDLGLALTNANGEIKVATTRDGRIGLAELKIGKDLAIAQPVALPVKHDPASSLTVQPLLVGGTTVRGGLALGKFAFGLRSASLGDSLQLAIPAATVGFDVAPGQPMAATVQIAGAQAVLPKLGVSTRKATLNGRLSGQKLDVDFALAQVTSVTGFVPMEIDGTASLDGSALTLKGKVHNGPAKMTLSVDGAYNLAKGSGKASLDLDPVVFAVGGLQPHNLLPPLRSRMQDISGSVDLLGSVSIADGRLASDLKLRVERLSGKVGPVILRNLNTVVEIDRPWPLSTKPDQVLSVELADVGLPLTNGLVRFKIDDGKQLTIAESRLEMIGGRVTLDPLALTLGAPAQQLSFQVENLSVAELFKQFGIAGLTGDGEISGRVPVTLFPAGLAIPNAKLAAAGPGVLKYDPNQAPLALKSAGESVAMVLLALSDFHYTKLELDLDRSLAGDVSLGLHIGGSNPSFYNGYPVELNLTISGRLDEVLRKGLAGYQVPDMIEERLKSYNH